jgi:hypothetical protein
MCLFAQVNLDKTVPKEATCLCEHLMPIEMVVREWWARLLPRIQGLLK